MQTCVRTLSTTVEEPTEAVAFGGHVRMLQLHGTIVQCQTTYVIRIVYECSLKTCRPEFTYTKVAAHIMVKIIGAQRDPTKLHEPTK